MNKFTKHLLIVVALVLLIISGCSVLNDYWPTRTNKAALTYTGRDPDSPRVVTLAEAKEIRSDTINEHITTQLNLKYQISLDKANYDSAMEINNNIEVAEAERQKMIGSVENPGWLLTILLGATGLGTYLIGARTQRPEDYNEAEMQVEVAKAVALAMTKKES